MTTDVLEAWGAEGQAPDMTLATCVTPDDVRRALDVLRNVAIRTPSIESAWLSEHVGARVFLKCENLQRVGAFKFRGAYHAMSRLSEAERKRGVLTYSSGNHAQAVAHAAALLGTRAVILMPENAPRVKLDRTTSFLESAPEGSRVQTYDPVSVSREELGRALASDEGMTIVPPYDHPHVIAGQGTSALELIEDVGDLDRLYVCVGGGGLLSGSAVIAKDLCDAVSVIGAEPALADDGARSFRDRVLRTVSNPATIADGARTPYLGRHTFPLILAHVDGFVTVSEDELKATMQIAFERLRLVIEPSGVLGLAAMLQDAGAGRLSPGAKVGVVVSGGNVDLDAVPSLLG
ncbi:MAG: pyridoxal-phosphate dependent enzyme [Planctomycetota bacterium]